MSDISFSRGVLEMMEMSTTDCFAMKSYVQAVVLGLGETIQLASFLAMNCTASVGAQVTLNESRISPKIEA